MTEPSIIAPFPVGTAEHRRVGVWDSQWWAKALGVPPLAAMTLGAALDFAQAEAFEQVWIHPDAYGHDRAVLDRFLASDHTGWRLGAAEKSPHWRRCYRGVGYDPRPVDLVIPELDDRHPYWKAANPGELLAALNLFQAALGIRYRWSAAKTGESLLIECHSGPRRAPLVETALPPPARDMRVEMDREWIRPLEPDERGAAAIVAYDANAAYLAAASSLTAGQGEYTHYGHVAGRAPSDIEALPGYWLATIRYTPPPSLPFPFSSGQHWITTPTLKLARQLGADVELAECYVWRHSRRPLEQWYRRVRNARGYLRELDTQPGAAIALMALKSTYARFLGGRVASERLDRHKVAQWDRSGDVAFRPDWRHAVIATAKANQYRSLLQLQADGWAPFAIITDCLYFAADDEIDRPSGLRVDVNPGAYKFAGMVPTSNAHAAVALSSASSDRRRLNALRDAWRSIDG